MYTSMHATLHDDCAAAPLTSCIYSLPTYVNGHIEQIQCNRRLVGMFARRHRDASNACHSLTHSRDDRHR